MTRGAKRKRAAVAVLILGLFSLPIIMTLLDVDDAQDGSEASFAVDLANLPERESAVLWVEERL